jgi:hypothetical protein
MEKLAVAESIIEQLGGNKFIAMTGAKNFVGDKNSLSFRLPSRFAKDGINFVRVVLNGLDLYDVEYGKIHGIKYKKIEICGNVAVDVLRFNFIHTTGLDITL